MNKRDDLKYWLQIYFTPNLGPVTFDRLLTRWGSPEQILSASESQLEEVCRQKNIAHKLINPDGEILNKVEKEIDKIRNNDVKFITCRNRFYPESLLRIHSYPPFLYAQGSFAPADENSIAIVGTRNASQGGLDFSRRLARGLAVQGYTIVSGLARGVDTEAHYGAIEAGGRTIAVMGSGLDVVYPSENKTLKDEICSSGAVVTEFSFGTKPERSNFPRRNRIISGLSLGVIVVEAGLHSGALITAKYALEQGREVMAVPGDVRKVNSRGVNQLIKQGAQLVESVDDVINSLPLWAGT